MNENDWSDRNPSGKEQGDNMSIADRFITAMFLPGEYPSLLKLSLGKVISYLCILILLVSAIQYAIPVLAGIAGYGGVRSFILNELPAFSLENGTFTVDGRYEQDNGDAGIYILVDTDEEQFSKADVDQSLMQVILVSHTNMLVYNNVTGMGGFVQEQRFSDYGNLVMNNETVAGLTPVIYISMAFMYVLLYAVTFIRYLLSGLIYAGIMYMLSRIMMGEITFGTLYKVALFAQTVGALVAAVANFIGTPLFVMTGSAFGMAVTVIVMNRVLFKLIPPPIDF